MRLIYRRQFIDISLQTFEDGIDSSGEALSSSGIEQATISFVENYLTISSPMGVAYTSGYRIGKMTYAYVQQTDVSLLFKDFSETYFWYLI